MLIIKIYGVLKQIYYIKSKLLKEDKHMEDLIERPFISVIIPAYNCERYIFQSIESVLCQSYKNLEIIVIDDCSTDSTYQIMQTFIKKDSRIKVYQNIQNLGVGKTRNRGIELAIGQWIAFLDSDDLWAKDKLEKQVNLLKKNKNAKLIFTGSAFISENGIPIDYVLHVPEKIERKQLLKQNLISCSSVLVKKEYMFQYPMFEEKNIHEDFVVWLKILEQESFAYGIDEPLLIYRKSSNSKSGNKLKAAKMNWNTYKIVGLNFFFRVYYMNWYMIKGILKYWNLK